MLNNTGSTWVTKADSALWTLTTGDGTKTVYAQFMDNTGKVSSASGTILLDTTAPAGTISINNGAASTTTSSVTLNLTCSETGSGCYQMQFSNDNATWSGLASYATTTTWTLSAGADGSRTVYARFKDNAGNVTTAVISDSIILDTTLPTGTILINNGASTDTTKNVTLNLTCSDGTGSGCSQVRLSNDGITWADWTSVVSFPTTTSWDLMAGTGTRIVYVRFKDNAGNVVGISPTISDTIYLQGVRFIVWSDDTNTPGLGEIYLRRSLDNGETWSDPATQVTNNAGDSQAPVITSSGSNIYMVWEDNALTLPPTDNGKPEIFFKKSADSGNTWTLPIRFTTNTGNSKAPAIAANGNNIYVVWQDDALSTGGGGYYDIFFKRSTDGGNTWQSTVRFTNTAGTCNAPVIAVSGTNVYVAWQDTITTSGDNEIFFKLSPDNGVTWWSTQQFTNNAGESRAPSLGVSGSNVYLAWQDDSLTSPGVPEIYFKRSIDGGSNWSIATQISSNTGISEAPAIGVDGNSIYVAWQDDSLSDPGKPEIFFKKSIDGGVSWANPSRFTTNTGVSKGASIVVNSNELYVAWQDDALTSPGSYEIFFKKSTNYGESWPLPVRITTNTGKSIHPSLN